MTTAFVVETRLQKFKRVFTRGGFAVLLFLVLFVGYAHYNPHFAVTGHNQPDTVKVGKELIYAPYTNGAGVKLTNVTNWGKCTRTFERDVSNNWNYWKSTCESSDQVIAFDVARNNPPMPAETPFRGVPYAYSPYVSPTSHIVSETNDVVTVHFPQDEMIMRAVLTEHAACATDAPKEVTVYDKPLGIASTLQGQMRIAMKERARDLARLAAQAREAARTQARLACPQQPAGTRVLAIPEDKNICLAIPAGRSLVLTTPPLWFVANTEMEALAWHGDPTVAEDVGVPGKVTMFAREALAYVTGNPLPYQKVELAEYMPNWTDGTRTMQFFPLDVRPETVLVKVKQKKKKGTVPVPAAEAASKDVVEVPEDNDDEVEPPRVVPASATVVTVPKTAYKRSDYKDVAESATKGGWVCYHRDPLGPYNPARVASTHSHNQ